MVDTLTIELGFSQQVAAEGLKNNRNERNAPFLDQPFARPESPQGNFNWRGEPQEWSREMRSH